jgi:hypothetical protein
VSSLALVVSCRVLVWSTSSSCTRNGCPLLYKPFISNTIILPRQARDKHRESTRKKSGVSVGGWLVGTGMLSPTEFIEGYLKVGRPVLMRGATLTGPTGLGRRIRRSPDGAAAAAAMTTAADEESTWGGWRAMMEKEVRKRLFGAESSEPFELKMIVLPRQARDKHRENSKQRCVFLLGVSESTRRANFRDVGDPM